MKKPEELTQDDLAYASPREKALISLALREAAERVETEVTVQTRSESYGRTRSVEKLNEVAKEYLDAAVYG
jgi:hypothetical protein